MTKDRFTGCLFGLALGDALGARYEGGLLEKSLWRLLGTTRDGEMRWTDDTQMALDLAESLLDADGVDTDALARRFAASYRWSRGYGPAAAKLLKRIARGEDWRQANRAIHADGSSGNGAAMRAPVIGLWCARRPDELAEAARQSAVITHAHPLGIEGAILLATAAAAALQSDAAPDILDQVRPHCDHDAFTSRLDVATDWLRTGAAPAPAEIARRLGNGIAATESCVTALYIASRFIGDDFTEMMAFTTACRGDVDTIGAMAGAVWGAARGASALRADQLDRLEQRDRLERVAGALHERVAPA